MLIFFASYYLLTCYSSFFWCRWCIFSCVIWFASDTRWYRFFCHCFVPAGRFINRLICGHAPDFRKMSYQVLQKLWGTPESTWYTFTWGSTQLLPCQASLFAKSRNSSSCSEEFRQLWWSKNRVQYAIPVSFTDEKFRYKVVVSVGSLWKAGSSQTPQVVSAKNTACSSCSKCHLFSIVLTAMSIGRGRHSQFFVEVLGLALAAKMCPDQPRAFKKVNYSNVFP